MQVTTEVKQMLKKLRLSSVLLTLPERLAYASGSKITHQEFLELVLSDEVERRGYNRLNNAIENSGIELDNTLERFDWSTGVNFDQELVRDLFSMSFVEEYQNVIFYGNTGVGKTFLANALAHVGVRKRKKVLVIRAEKMFKNLSHARIDGTYEKELLKLLTPDILCIDDFGLKNLKESHENDFYEIVVERHACSSTIITSNRSVDEWIGLFNDPILANSILDRLAHRAYQIKMEGESYRKIEGEKLRNLRKNLTSQN